MSFVVAQYVPKRIKNDWTGVELPDPDFFKEEETLQMQKMTFKKLHILAKLKKNREEHLKIVREAQVGFREKAINLFKQKVADLEEGGEVDLGINLHPPQNHLDDFDRVIAMLEMCVEETVELEEPAFQAYVMNRWRWQRDFLVSSAPYSQTALEFCERRPE